MIFLYWRRPSTSFVFFDWIDDNVNIFQITEYRYQIENAYIQGPATPGSRKLEIDLGVENRFLTSILGIGQKLPTPDFDIKFFEKIPDFDSKFVEIDSRPPDLDLQQFSTSKIEISLFSILGVNHRLLWVTGPCK